MYELYERAPEQKSARHSGHQYFGDDWDSSRRSGHIRCKLCSSQKWNVKRREYIRHGTQSLIANWQVATGGVLTPSIAPTRKEEDFATHIRNTIATASTAGWIFIVDQLDTHKSEALVRRERQML